MVSEIRPKILFVILLLLIGLTFYFYKQTLKISQVKPIPNPPTQTSKGKIKYPQDYTLVMVGDSMTEALGNFKEIFAKNQVNLSREKRLEWVNERIAYIKNHIVFAKAHNIPVINIFEKSLLENGDGNSDYISNQDFIHPSPTGIIFIQKTIADFIYNNNLNNNLLK